MRNFIQKLSIPQTIVFAYASMIFFGGILLSLPISSASGEWTPFIDAVFTATSAICVTGQVVVNTAYHWSYFGKTIIILWIEIGGLGFMTIWIIIYLLFFGHRPDLKQRMIVSESLSLTGEESLLQRVWQIVRLALITQLIGAILLSFVFIPEHGLTKGAYFSFFHSISAFCNAGFDIIGDSLIGYQNNPLIILTIAGLIMAGGLGFLVWDDVLHFYKTKKLRQYSRLVLLTTGSLWIIGTILFGLLESKNGTFSHLPFSKQVMNYFFLSVTPRTAGYVNIDYATLSLGSIFLTLVFMFIGASSGSTGGGMKVSTFIVLIVTMSKSLQNKPLIIFKRQLSLPIIRRAFFIFSAGMSIIGISTLILLMTETIPEGFGIEYILIEVFSCLGTVGLTMGLTPDLTGIGKILLILLMLIGRVGVMTFLLSITREKRETKIAYPDLNILIG